MINMSVRRAIRRALNNANRRRDYSIEFSEITPSTMEELSSIVSGGRENLLSYADDFLERLRESDRAGVVDNILTQLKKILDNALVIQLGNLGVEGPTNNPTKRMKDIYTMGEQPINDWFSTNKQDLYDKFINGDFRPLYNTYTFFENQGLSQDYQNIISEVQTNAKVDETLPLLNETDRMNIAPTSSDPEIITIFKEIETSRLKELADILGFIPESKTPLPTIEINAFEIRSGIVSQDDNLKNLLTLFFSANKQTNSTSSFFTQLENVSLLAFTSFIRRLFTNTIRDGITFLNLYANLVSRRGDVDFPASEKFRLGTGDLISETKMYRDLYDYLKPELPYEEWVRGKDTVAFGNQLEAFMKRRTESPRIKRVRRSVGNLELLSYYGGSSRRNTPLKGNFEVGILPEDIMSSLLGFIQMFDNGYNFNDIPPFRRIESGNYETVEQTLNQKLTEAIKIVRRGILQEFNSMLEIIVSRRELSFKSIKGVSALRFLDNLDLLEDELDV